MTTALVVAGFGVAGYATLPGLSALTRFSLWAPLAEGANTPPLESSVSQVASFGGGAG
jgi:hypothetical protein